MAVYQVCFWDPVHGRMVELRHTHDMEKVKEEVRAIRARGKMAFVYDEKGRYVSVPREE